MRMIISLLFLLKRLRILIGINNGNQFFSPVIINHPTQHIPFIGIRAQFHEPTRKVQYEIVITPKMSFGSGHHPTTLIMIKMMSEINFSVKLFWILGTGTGSLSILSEKL